MWDGGWQLNGSASWAIVCGTGSKARGHKCGLLMELQSLQLCQALRVAVQQYRHLPGPPCFLPRYNLL